MAEMDDEQENVNEQCNRGKVIIPPARFSDEEEWVQTYKEQFGTEPSFF